MTVDIRHVVVLMLENRSFDCMLGRLAPSDPGFDGLSGKEANTWHRADAPPSSIGVWNDPTLTAQSVCIPDPDPGELFTDIHMQIRGLDSGGNLNPQPTMDGFVDNYVRQATASTPDPKSVMHVFTPDQVPVISQLARAFGVSDRWFASAPCQTWPNRFFAHTGTANGYVDNSPSRLHLMPTIFQRLSEARQSWSIYFHDVPQAAALAGLWSDVATHFRLFEEDFANHAAQGALPAYSFIEPRYYPDLLLNHLPNDEHPPHNVAYGEELIAAVYNAVRNGPAWRQTLLIVTYDEHGGCYDHVVPPPATPPGGPNPDGFAFDSFGVRVPAVIVSPYVAPGSVIRPSGSIPFDHTSIIATLRKLFGVASLTPRDAAAPDLLSALGPSPDNDGPPSITAPAIPPAPAQIAAAAVKPPNDLQRSLSSLAVRLPTLGADVAAHIRRLNSISTLAPIHATADAAAAEIKAHLKAFLGRL